ncbi:MULTISPECIES: hypothetical protein [Streptosporangium]|uniref:Fe-S cluster-containing radical SAM superfamily protein n=1 Tax=Streptosporangium brasiliense TaxID=47480 RepID=A0ABT9R6L6_9ACTN|nr:hypothetical protein [Streptosporangium brasiliense]MDP9864885.1 putative Fe-S cluster-containing radical SAM superfamily protein [Streptosporangium brasiliense]
MASIKTDDLSTALRERSIRPSTRQLLISRIEGSSQERDLSEPPNCGGHGRIRHFRIETPAPWPANPLPLLPASRRLGVSPATASNAQVFQNAACNWRCWYCFVPFNLLSANESRASWLTADELVNMYLAEPERPLVIDCSGGQPDLIPEWIPWMMDALAKRGLQDEVYLWSDDNLSNDYFWRYLTLQQRAEVADYRLYGRVCCFKGFDADSFTFNTKAEPDLYDRQFELFGRLLALGIDLYAYATFTASHDRGLAQAMTTFVDRLQQIHPNLPLRLVPLRIEAFGVVQPRVGEIQQRALAIQEAAVLIWNEQLRSRFSAKERAIPMPDVAIQG